MPAVAAAALASAAQAACELSPEHGHLLAHASQHVAVLLGTSDQVGLHGSGDQARRVSDVGDGG